LRPDFFEKFGVLLCRSLFLLDAFRLCVQNFLQARLALGLFFFFDVFDFKGFDVVFALLDDFGVGV
jgi:hypothetical protein